MSHDDMDTQQMPTPGRDGGEPPLRVPAELSEDIVAAVDFSEIELDPAITESPHVVTPVGVLPLEPSPIEGTLRKARAARAGRDRGGDALLAVRPTHPLDALLHRRRRHPQRQRRRGLRRLPLHRTSRPSPRRSSRPPSAPCSWASAAARRRASAPSSSPRSSEMQGAAGRHRELARLRRDGLADRRHRGHPPSSRPSCAPTTRTPRCARGRRSSTSPPAARRRPSCARCARATPRCRSSPRAARPPTACWRPSAPARTPSSGPRPRRRCCRPT